MTFYLETSALASVYLKEERSSKVLPLFEQGPPVISRLTITEVVSSVAAAHRSKRLSASIRDRLLQAFWSDLRGFVVLEIGRETTIKASELLLKWPLRASDALQLASFALLHEDSGGSVTFVCADQRLVTACRGERLAITEV